MSSQEDNTDWSLEGIGRMCRQAEAERLTDATVSKHRISIGSVDKEIPELSDMYECDFRTRIGKTWGEEFERKMFTYMLVMAIEEIYVYTETHNEGLKWTCEWHFSMDRPEGRQCEKYNMYHLVTMTDEEFDRIKKNTNYGLVKSWREIMRGKYDSK
jgi:hypothetical protein